MSYSGDSRGLLAARRQEKRASRRPKPFFQARKKAQDLLKIRFETLLLL